MKICKICLRVINENIKVGNKCPNKNCFGDIIFIEDIVSSIYISLRKKNYKPIYVLSGEYSRQGWKICGVSFFPSQCYDLLPPPPKGFIKRYAMDSVVVERELINSEPSKLHIEAEMARLALHDWVEKLPTIINLLVGFHFSTELEAKNFINKLIILGYFYAITLREDDLQFAVFALRDVKEEEKEVEFANIVCIYEDTNAIFMTYRKFQLK